MRDINFIRLQNFIAFHAPNDKKKRYMINKLKALETEFEELKANNKCPCLSDYSTCLAEDKWELAQKEIEQLKAQNEKMKCCGNCGNDKCTSKYRGNSAYHRQSNGFSCADNEDWIPRKMELTE